MKYETEQMIFSYPQDEWFFDHSDLSRYVSNCTGDGGVWCLTSFSTIWQLYRGNQFYWWRKPEYPEKITDLPQVTDKLLLHISVLSTTRISWIRTHSFSDDRHWLHIVGRKYIYHMIITTNALIKTYNFGIKSEIFLWSLG